MFLFAEYNANLSEKNASTTDGGEIPINIYDSERVMKMVDLAWTLINCLFVVGSITGALLSKFMLERMGRKKSFLYHNIFSILASLLVLIAPYVKSPVCAMVSRFLFGIHAGNKQKKNKVFTLKYKIVIFVVKGFCSNISPIYLSEIPPNSLRGSAGVLFQLFITFGIAFAQVLGLDYIFGTYYIQKI